MVGTYRMSFKARNSGCGGTNTDNNATGGTCHAFVKVINSTSYGTELFERVETTNAAGDAFADMVLDYEITEAHVGHILQTGFMNYAGDYAPTGMHYDDVVVAEYTPTPAPTPEPTPAPAANYAEDDFESYSIDGDETLAGWKMYVNVFGRGDDGATGAYEYGYGPFDAPNASHPNQSSVSAIQNDSAELGADNGTQYLNVFSNYGDEAHATKNLETNVFREYTVAEADVGTTFTYSFIAKRPAADTGCGSANADTSAVANKCEAFIKVLNPGNGYAAEPGVYLDTSGVSLTEWEAHSLTVDITAGMVGWPLQFGYSSTGGNYAPTSVLYDNMVVSQADTPADPTASDLFVSEYGEGPSGTSSWGKYLEIANFTGADVSLDGYLLAGITNGGDGYEKFVSFTAGTTLANGEVWVIGRAESGDGSPESLYGQIDQVDTDISHNGDDAWHLVAGTSDSYTLVDAAIGDAGDDPGSYFSACGDGETRDSSWIRKATVSAGADSWATSAGTDADTCQWTIVSQSADALDYSTVGNHTFTGSAE